MAADDHEWPELPSSDAWEPKGSPFLNSALVVGSPCPTKCLSKQRKTVSIQPHGEEWMPTHLECLTERSLWVHRRLWLDRHLTWLRGLPCDEPVARVVAVLEAMSASCTVNAAELVGSTELAQILLHR